MLGVSGQQDFFGEGGDSEKNPSSPGYIEQHMQRVAELEIHGKSNRIHHGSLRLPARDSVSV